ncbi:MAG: hypothetical protein K8W52_06645 [Deltaproteobacteria bacterium]|nr:hypothetical protein [Deltaproteobacteria bacterium]
MSNFLRHGQLLVLCSVLAVGACMAADAPDPGPVAESAGAPLTADELAALSSADIDGDGTPATLAPGETAWLESPPASFEVELPANSSAAVCASTYSTWDAATVTHAVKICADGLCHWTKYQVVEQVTCNNYCSSPTTWSCTAWGTATHPGHATTLPAVQANSECQIPCGSLSTCSGCVYH